MSDHMHVTTYNGSSWSDVDLTTAIGDTSERERVIADPAVYVSSDGRDTIVFRGESQTVWEYELNGSQWTRTRPY